MNSSIATILYASDLDEGSKPAFLEAAKQAISNNSQIVSLNVVEPISPATEVLLGHMVEGSELKRLREHGLEELKAVMESRVDQFYSSHLENSAPLQKRPIVRVEVGPAAETIINVAKEIKADLIVMGTRTKAHSSVGRFFVGSTAQNVMRLSDTPLLIVPLTYEHC